MMKRDDQDQMNPRDDQEKRSQTMARTDSHSPEHHEEETRHTAAAIEAAIDAAAVSDERRRDEEARRLAAEAAKRTEDKARQMIKQQAARTAYLDELAGEVDWTWIIMEAIELTGFPPTPGPVISSIQDTHREEIGEDLGGVMTAIRNQLTAPSIDEARTNAIQEAVEEAIDWIGMRDAPTSDILGRVYRTDRALAINHPTEIRAEVDSQLGHLAECMEETDQMKEMDDQADQLPQIAAGYGTEAIYRIKWTDGGTVVRYFPSVEEALKMMKELPGAEVTVIALPRTTEALTQWLNTIEMEREETR